MSPALHTTKDGSQYVLYGQGGETARGNYVLLVVLTSTVPPLSACWMCILVGYQPARCVYWLVISRLGVYIGWLSTG